MLLIVRRIYMEHVGVSGAHGGGIDVPSSSIAYRSKPSTAGNALLLPATC